MYRSRAAKMELWREGVDVALERLLSHLVLVRPPVWVYAAQVSHTRARKREKLVRRQVRTHIHTHTHTDTSAFNVSSDAVQPSVWADCVGFRSAC